MRIPDAKNTLVLQIGLKPRFKNVKKLKIFVFQCFEIISLNINALVYTYIQMWIYNLAYDEL